MDYASFVLSIVAIVVSIASVVVSEWIYRMDRKVGIKPVVVFTKDQPTEDDPEGWHICNVGNGPAINIKLARRRGRQNREWEEYRQCPTLAREAKFPIGLGGYELECDYEDIDGRQYSSRCKDWFTSFPRKKLPPNSEETKRLEGIPHIA